MIEVREAHPEEYDEVGRVTSDAYREYFAAGAADEDHRYLRHIGDITGRADRTTIVAAVEDGRILGSLTLELEGRVGDWDGDPPLAPGEAHIRMLGVVASERRRGIGRMLMAEAEDRARAAGRSFITLHTTQLMTAAQRMYASLGYEPTEDEILPDGFVLMGFRKAL